MTDKLRGEYMVPDIDAMVDRIRHSQFWGVVADAPGNTSEDTGARWIPLEATPIYFRYVDVKVRAWPLGWDVPLGKRPLYEGEFTTYLLGEGPSVFDGETIDEKVRRYCTEHAVDKVVVTWTVSEADYRVDSHSGTVIID